MTDIAVITDVARFVQYSLSRCALMAYAIQAHVANAPLSRPLVSTSQDFEREADCVGMYILARAGRPYADAPNFWRRMGQESPGSIKYASTHPASAERFIRLDKPVAEIQAKVASGAPLLPEAKAPGVQATDSGSTSKP
ncbi:MAG: M48 family metalloprotease [Gemmatimonadaceae bacterium]